jgi:catechol 2,3-dioxygenase-like lactoylglutathione lyase family enzyme
MTVEAKPAVNVKRALPFFWVTDLEKSLRYYTDGLGFTMTKSWKPEGKLRWCWLELGETVIMLQQFWREGPNTNLPKEKLGVGVDIYFDCDDALAIYRDLKAKGIAAKRPFVGNGLWVTAVTDPDGYKLLFESPADAPEETEYAEPGAQPNLTSG